MGGVVRRDGYIFRFLKKLKPTYKKAPEDWTIIGRDSGVFAGELTSSVGYPNVLNRVSGVLRICERFAYDLKNALPPLIFFAPPI